MATLATQTIGRAGLTPAYSAAAGGGDSFTPDADTFIHIKNGSGGSITVTAATPGSVLGMAVADVAVAIPAGQERMIGPFPADHFAQPDDGLADLTYTGVTSLTLAVLKLAKP